MCARTINHDKNIRCLNINACTNLKFRSLVLHILLLNFVWVLGFLFIFVFDLKNPKRNEGVIKYLDFFMVLYE